MKVFKIILGLTSIIIIVSLGLVYLNYRNSEILKQNESSASKEVVSLYFNKDVNEIYNYQNRNYSLFPNMNLLTEEDLLMNYKNYNFLPISIYYEEGQMTEDIVDSYDQYALFLRNLRRYHYEQPWDMYQDISDGRYKLGEETENGILFKLDYIHPNEDFMKEQYIMMLSELGYDYDSYFYEYILLNNQTLLTDIVNLLDIDEESYSDLTEGEKNSIYNYLEDNYSHLYEEGFEHAIIFFTDRFVEHLDNLEFSEILFDKIEIEIEVYKLKELPATYDEFDKYLWGINYTEFFEKLSELGIPYLY